MSSDNRTPRRFPASSPIPCFNPVNPKRLRTEGAFSASWPPSSRAEPSLPAAFRSHPPHLSCVENPKRSPSRFRPGLEAQVLAADHEAAP